MPIPIDVVQAAEDNPLRVALEPARNALASMYLLLDNLEMPGVHDWIHQTRSQFSLEESDRHKLVTTGFFYAILPEDGWASFPAFLDHLANTKPVAFRQKLLNDYARVYTSTTKQNSASIDWQKALSSADHYISFLEQGFPHRVDPDLEAVAYRYVIDPPALKKLLVDHLRWIWDRHLAAEWVRVRPILQDSVHSFQRVDLRKLDHIEAARLVTGHELTNDKWCHMLAETQRITFIPNAHIGPYTKILDAVSSLGVIFGARQPENSDARIPDLDRAELVVRLSALADDTRLRILHFIAQNGEQHSPDIIRQLDLSQSATSRHLQQLSATGYLTERWREGSKWDSLNPDRIDDTFRALARFLQAKNN